jgi:hypothetical protein
VGVVDVYSLFSACCSVSAYTQHLRDCEMGCFFFNFGCVSVWFLVVLVVTNCAVVIVAVVVGFVFVTVCKGFSGEM